MKNWSEGQNLWWFNTVLVGRLLLKVRFKKNNFILRPINLIVLVSYSHNILKLPTTHAKLSTSNTKCSTILWIVLSFVQIILNCLPLPLSLLLLLRPTTLLGLLWTFPLLSWSWQQLCLRCLPLFLYNTTRTYARALLRKKIKSLPKLFMYT